MRSILSLGGAVLLSLSSAWSIADDQRVSLAGYQDFKFGTPEADVRSRIRVRIESPDKRLGGIWLHSEETVQIDGNTYQIDFKIKDGSLTQVNLTRHSADDPVGCAWDFMDVLALLQAKYGAPDQRPDLNKSTAVFFGLAKFTFNDGSRILAVGGSDPGGCDHTVAYISGLGKDTF